MVLILEKRTEIRRSGNWGTPLQRNADYIFTIRERGGGIVNGAWFCAVYNAKSCIDGNFHLIETLLLTNYFETKPKQKTLKRG